MVQSWPGRVFQRLAFLSMFALVFSFMAPVVPVWGSEADTLEEAQQEAPESSAAGEPVLEVEPDASLNTDNSPAPAEAPVANPDNALPGEPEDDSLAEEEGDALTGEAGEGSGAEEASTEDDGEAGEGSGEEEASTEDDDADGEETEVMVVLQADTPEGEVTLLSLEEDDTEALELESEPAALAIAATGLQPEIDSPDNVVAILVGSGITYSNIKYTGSPQALGTFTNGDGIIGFPSGILMGTGNITDVVGPNQSSGTGTNHGLPGDPGLTDLADQQTYDAAILSFDFVPTGNMVEFNYVFSSEEYNEYVGDYNDVFAFYVNGHSCATVGGAPVSVNSINNDSNSHLFIDNTAGQVNTEMDGMTVVLTCTAPVNPGQTNTMMFKIADSRDGIYDSNVFLQAKSFMIVIPDPVDPPVTDEDPVQKPVKPHKKAKYGDKVVSEPAMVTSLPETGTGPASSNHIGLGLVAVTLSLGLLACGSLRNAMRR